MSISRWELKTPSSSCFTVPMLTYRPGNTVTVMFFDFSSEFNPIQPAMSFHLQKFSDNSANVGCITDGKDAEPSAA